MKRKRRRGKEVKEERKWKQWYVMCVHAYISRVHTIYI